LSFVAIALVAACAPPGDPAAPRFADNRAAATPPAAAPRIDGDESMAALTAEVRQLRVAVEELARSQQQTQALSVYLSAQQGRLAQATQQLEAARKDVASATDNSRDSEAMLKRLSEELARVTDRTQRAAIEDAMHGFERERGAAELALQQAQARESELSRALAREEDRWSDLLARLEQLTQ
jgi:chromosome segregation ATPase